MHADPSIRALLAPFEIATLEADPSTICALDEDLRIAYVNRAWVDFARASGAEWDGGAWGVGQRMLDAVPGVLRPFYESFFAEAQRLREPAEHSYECSTPTTHRRYRMRVVPCGENSLLVVHSLAYESPRPAVTGPPIESVHRHANGFVTQCSHCRRVRRADASDQWDWVAEYVERIPPSTTHGLCLLCYQYYYPA